MKVKLELNLTERGAFLNYWDWKNGDDVVCEIVNGKLITSGQKEISLEEFVDMVRARAAR